MSVNHAVVLLAAVALSPSAPALAAPPVAACPNDRGLVSVVDVATEFARRSVEIVTLAATADDAALGKLVSPTADFMLWEGDSGWGPRGGLHGREDLHGVVAARAFADYLAAARFEFAVSSPGPISTSPCGWQSVTVTFANAAGTRSYVVQFDYLAGRLVKAEGTLATLTRGTIGIAR